MNKRTALKIGFAILSLYILLSLTTADEFLAVLSSVNMWLIAASIALIFPIIFFRVLRWRQLLTMNEHSFSFFEVFRIYLIGIFLGVITPSKIGDIGKSYYLYKKGVSPGRSLSLSLLDRGFDVLVVFVVSLFGFLPFLGTNSIPLMILVAGLLIVGLATVFSHSLFMRLIQPFLTRLGFLNKHIAGDVTDVEELYYPLGQLKKKPATLAGLVMLSVFIWSLSAFLVILLLLSIGIELGFLTALVVVSFAATISLIPVTIAGIGLREGTFVTVLALVGIEPAAAITISLLYFVIGSVVPGFIGYPLYLITKKESLLTSPSQNTV